MDDKRKMRTSDLVRFTKLIRKNRKVCGVAKDALVAHANYLQRQLVKKGGAK